MTTGTSARHVSSSATGFETRSLARSWSSRSSQGSGALQTPRRRSAPPPSNRQRCADETASRRPSRRAPATAARPRCGTAPAYPATTGRHREARAGWRAVWSRRSRFSSRCEDTECDGERRQHAEHRHTGTCITSARRADHEQRRQQDQRGQRALPQRVKHRPADSLGQRRLDQVR